MSAAEMRDALLARGDWLNQRGHAQGITKADLDAYATQVEAETRAGLAGALAKALHAESHICEGPADGTCYLHRSQSARLLAALPAPEPSSGAAPVEERSR